MTRGERREYDHERRFNKRLAEEERKWHAEIKALMDTGLSFDDAWIAAGGMIIPDITMDKP